MPPVRSTKKSRFEVPARLLRWRCNPKSLGIRTTNDVESSGGIIGQDRALRALRMGLEMKHDGYNIFVTGHAGTGKMTMIKQLLKEFQIRPVNLRDHCYLFNYHDIDQPMLVSLPAGQARKLRADLDEFRQDLMKNVPAAFESRRFQDEKKKRLEHFQERQQTVLREFEKKVKDRGFAVVQVQAGNATRPDIAPMIDDQPVNYEQLDALVGEGKLTPEQHAQILADHATLEKSMELVLREMRNIDRKAKESMEELTRSHIGPAVHAELERLSKTYQNEKLNGFFKSLEEDIMGDLDRFRPQADENKRREGEVVFLEFIVNILVDNADSTGAPVIIETNPKFKNLFGTIEREIDTNGTWRTDFTLIKPGSLLKADGGFIVINALDAIAEPGVWQTLKRTLRNRLLEIQSPDSTPGASSALKPESIPLDVKVIMIGDASTYFILYEQDEDFRKVFKVRADFDVEMKNNDETIRQYVSFLKTVCDNSKLLPFNSSGVAAVIEHGARIAGRRDKLTTRFNEIADLARESSYWTHEGGDKIVSGSHVRKAVAEAARRVNLSEEKVHAMLIEGTIILPSSGTAVGQINGLTIYDVGDHTFGRPARITVRTAFGKQGIINIEREAAMSGPTHNKGVLILGGYLRGMYAHNKPLALSASIAFEQSYSGIDGDSASSTEVYAILSSLSGIPLRQDIAVTGSVSQLGEVQPIGGANEKIEGFFDICKSRGLTGTQGVMIPRVNLPDLMLRDDVIEAVAAGTFHVWAVSHIDEGIELLTGVKAGTRGGDGSYSPVSVHGRVDERLRSYAERWKEIELS